MKKPIDPSRTCQEVERALVLPCQAGKEKSDATEPQRWHHRLSVIMHLIRSCLCGTQSRFLDSLPAQMIAYRLS
jgi:hypothetical protein